jgi:hypothetical protein
MSLKQLQHRIMIAEAKPSAGVSVPKENVSTHSAHIEKPACVRPGNRWLDEEEFA